MPLLPVAAAEAAEHSGVQPEAGEHRGEHREEARDRHHEHVPVRDVRELVPEHGLDLLRLEPPPQPLRHRDCRVLRVPARRERVRDVAVDDRDARLRQVRHRAEPLDHRVQLGCFLGRDDLGPGCAERELVGGVVLEEGEADDDHEHRHEPEVEDAEQDDAKDDVEQAEQRAREEHAQGQAPIASEVFALHEPNGTQRDGSCSRSS